MSPRASSGADVRYGSPDRGVADPTKLQNDTEKISLEPATDNTLEEPLNRPCATMPCADGAVDFTLESCKPDLSGTRSSTGLESHYIGTPDAKRDLGLDSSVGDSVSRSSCVPSVPPFPSDSLGFTTVFKDPEASAPRIVVDVKSEGDCAPPPVPQCLRLRLSG